MANLFLYQIILSVNAYPGANFDKYAETYLEDALQAGLDIKGVYIVDVKDVKLVTDG